MNKKILALAVCMIISLITLLVVINMNTSLTNEINDIRAMVSDISRESSETDINDIDNLTSQISELTTLVSGLSEIDSDISDLKTSISGLTDSMPETESCIKEFRDSLTDRLASIEGYLPVLEQIQADVRTLMEGMLSSEDAGLFLAKAADSDYPDLYYLSAIYHDPSNSMYYEQYLNFLEESDADIDSYIMLGTIVENSIMSGSYEESENLLEVYEKIKGIVNEMTAPVVPELSIDEVWDIWNAAVEAFYECSSSEPFSYSEFSDLYNAVIAAESGVSDIITPEAEAVYDNISSIYSLISSAQAVAVIASNMDESPDSVFVELYPLTIQSLDGVMSLFASRDKSIESTYAPVISAAENQIIEAVRHMDMRYDNLKIGDFEREISSISDTMNHSDFKKKYNELYTGFSTMLQSLRRVDEFPERIAGIQESLEKISRQIYVYDYSRYQQWAGAEISEISNRMAAEKDKTKKLSTLVESGYFNIDRNLLIPELATVYSSLWDDGYVKNSSEPLENLLELYPVDTKMLGEV